MALEETKRTRLDLCADALLLHAADNVATALRTLQPGQNVQIQGQGTETTCSCVVYESIAMCHKFALRDIARGELVIKYGESIGCATSDIRKGNHVHIDNLSSLRAIGAVRLATCTIVGPADLMQCAKSHERR